MKEHLGCRHLDYDNNYIDCELITIEPEGWKYWERKKASPAKVQFCKLKGRIDGIFACINKGEMDCYED
jgi:hypothetical protein